jgi:3-isopropylmalate/(R)-2-methylmalate dehydratase small subunit
MAVSTVVMRALPSPGIAVSPASSSSSSSTLSCSRGVPLAAALKSHVANSSSADRVVVAVAGGCERRSSNVQFVARPKSGVRSSSCKSGLLQVRAATAVEDGESEGSKSGSAATIHGRCFVVGDNIDTDQIIPAEYLTLVPSKPEEYQKLGSYAMIGLPAKWGRFIEEGKSKTEYKVVIGGANFGCGSSREHAPVALGAAGVRAVVAESYARIFFRNSVATGELYPVESQGRICDENKTGDYVTVDLELGSLVNHTTGKQYALKPIGEAGPVIDAGGIFAYARKTGMIPATA